MKFVRLLLQAFGPFTDVELDFASSSDNPTANLHLIYGPNEAGKSSALRAMTDLRFGIHPQSPDNFVHPYNRLRIAGVFLGVEGEDIGLVRNKGKHPTLSRFDPVNVLSSASLEVGSELEAALTGGLKRDEFEKMFGLNHMRLRDGGKQLLSGEGELGLALFEASVGIRSIAAILADLDADAKTYFHPRSNAQNATINQARQQLDQQRDLWKKAQIRPVDWQAMNRAHEQARDALADIDRDLESLRRRENDLTKLRAVRPVFHDYDNALAELQTLDDAPDLTESAREERLTAEQALRRAENDLQDAELDLKRCANELNQLVIEDTVLEQAAAIERLSAAAIAAAGSQIEVRQQESIIGQISDDMAMVAARIAPQRSIDELLIALPSEADRVSLEDHLGEISKLDERLDGQRNRATELDQKDEVQSDGHSILPDPTARQILVTALANAQALGDVSRLAESERNIQGLHGQLTQALSDLGIESVDALRRARPLLDAQILNARKELSNLEEGIRRLRDDDRRLDTDLKDQQLRQRRLAATGKVITAETLRLARERRDEGWRLVRKAYVERIQSPEDLGMHFDPDRLLPEAFEAAQSDVDRQADLLRIDATRTAHYEECAARIMDMETRRAEIARELGELYTQHHSQQAAWSRTLTNVGLPDLDPEALREWQKTREETLDRADRLAQAKADRDRLQSAAATAVGALSTALASVGESVQGSILPQLMIQADQWDKSVTKIEAEQKARAKEAKSRQTDRERLQTQIIKTEGELESHLTAVQGWQPRLYLATNTTPATIKARMDELDSLKRQAVALAEAKSQQAQRQTVVEDFLSQVRHLAMVLGDPIPKPALAEDYSDRLKRRLAVSWKQDQQRQTLIHDRQRAQDKKQKAEAEQATQVIVLKKLCTAAGIDEVNHLPECEDRAARKRQLKKIVETLRQQLAQAWDQSLDELRISLADQDTIAIDSELGRCCTEINRLKQEQKLAGDKEQKTRQALEAVDSSDQAAKAREAMEGAAARYRSAIKPWARLKLAHALLQKSLNQFRERAQAPMVAAASTYFALMTGGRYQRLIADETDNTPVLRAERDDGKLIAVGEMSEGTADQLYLALRLAALERRRTSHPPMPLVLDDVLVTSDDERAANILRALARFAEGSQVMLFTHHRHLIDVAHSALGAQGVLTHCL